MRTSLATGIAAALIVTVLGGFMGWYAYLRTHASQIQAADTARGFTTGAKFFGLGGSGAPATSDESQSSSTFLGSTFLGSLLAGGSQAVSDSTSTPLATSSPAKTPRLWRAAKTPIAGFGFTYNNTAKIRYVERATGYIFETDPWTGEVSRLTNTLNPKTQEAFFPSDTIIERSLGENGITTRSGTVGRSATSSAYLSTTLAANIRALAAYPALSSILYVQQSGSGSDVVSAAADGSQAKVLFSSPLVGWSPILVPGHTVIAQFASDGVPGSAYDIRKDGSLAALVSNIPGLMVLPRASSTALLWSTADGRSLTLFARTSDTASAATLSLKTVAAKCVWAPQSGSSMFAYCAVPHALPAGAFLDPWHQGALFTSDAWWQIDVGAGATQALYADENDIDVRDPQIDESGRFIAFLNGRDGSLWVLRIVQ